MESLESKYLKKLKFDSKMLKTIHVLGEYKGKEELYTRQSPDVLEKLLESAIVESTEASNRIEGVTAPHKRIENIVKEKTKPRNRPEQEIAGYKDVLNLIHQSHQNIPLDENVILQFHSMLYRYTTIKSGFWKKVDNAIVDKNPDGSTTIRFQTVPAKDTSNYMKKTITLYNKYIEDEIHDHLILVPLFIFDFLCIHPFKDGNGRIARLLTLLLLYKCGYRVGKYISLERIIEESKDSYYDSLIASSNGWHQGEHNIFPWLDYFHAMLLAAYKEFEGRVGVFKRTRSKTGQIIAQINRFIKPFSISELEKACPNVTRDMIRKVLRDLRDAGKIKSTGIGRNAKWKKV
ncbi:MAG: Fic family protein [Candidatus Omnitrophica bacterium]|nr:Fic family protein [Candidatus Omnitrophota bacterium]